MTVEFNNKEWKKRISKIIKEHPELVKMSGKIAIYLNNGDTCKVKIEDKTL
jgi:hypothetical protein